MERVKPGLPLWSSGDSGEASLQNDEKNVENFIIAIKNSIDGPEEICYPKDSIQGTKLGGTYYVY